MKGIILAGGLGTRLLPVTKSVSKQLLSIYDKPMIFYPLSTLMLAGIREVLIICTGDQVDSYHALLGEGESYGISISYRVQMEPKGIAQAFIIGDEFIGSGNVCLALGDNIFYGAGFSELLQKASRLDHGARIFVKHVSDQSRFGVVEIGPTGGVLSIEEKPAVPKSSLALTGLYFFDRNVVEIARGLKPSVRGEYEIVDVLNVYLERQVLEANILDRGFTWLDTGTADSMLEASQFVQTVEKVQGKKVACLEEIAFVKGWIDVDSVYKSGLRMKGSPYGKYLIKLSDRGL
ncbi:glucose-1-phosphate thymidylyltransferase RfbA [Litorivicinus sp.]|nr:glucose-1-phosphate thymidylyltransferase RfbA [Litorivicinus sp.]